MLEGLNTCVLNARKLSRKTPIECSLDTPSKFASCADELRGSAKRLGITGVSFFPTPNGIVAIKNDDNGDAPSLPMTCGMGTFVGAPPFDVIRTISDLWRGEEVFQHVTSGMHEEKRSTSDPNLIATIQNAKEQPFGLSLIEQERKQRYRVALDGVLNAPERSVLILTFRESLEWINVAMPGDEPILEPTLRRPYFFFDGDPEWAPLTPEALAAQRADDAAMLHDKPPYGPVPRTYPFSDGRRIDPPVRHKTGNS